MRRQGIVEIIRRGACLILLVAAVVAGLGDVREPAWLTAMALAALAIGLYVLIPRPRLPPGVLHHERLPAVVMPDVVGFLLSTTFLALPLVVMQSDPIMSGNLWLLVFWIPAPFGLAILWIAANYACTWVRLDADRIEIATARHIVTMRYSEMARVVTRERRLPAWIGPALVLFGGWRGLGVALLHARRPRHSLVFERVDGMSVELPIDALPGARRIIGAIRHAGITVDDELSAMTGKSRLRRGHDLDKSSAS